MSVEAGRALFERGRRAKAAARARADEPRRYLDTWSPARPAHLVPRRNDFGVVTYGLGLGQTRSTDTNEENQP